MKFLLFLGLLAVVSAQSTECIFCKDIVKAIDTDIREANATITDVSKLIEDLCYDIGGPKIGEECTIVVESIDDILYWITYELTPNDICKKLGLCT